MITSADHNKYIGWASPIEMDNHYFKYSGERMVTEVIILQVWNNNY